MSVSSKNITMMDVAKYVTFRNFTILNKVLLFLIKLNKTAVQSVPKIFIQTNSFSFFFIPMEIYHIFL